MLISRNDVVDFPCFFNHESARMWLKDKYGKFFVLAEVSYDGPDKIYHYHLVQDKRAYLSWRESLMDQNILPYSDLYSDLYQTIEITDRGKLTVYFKDKAESVAY